MLYLAIDQHRKQLTVNLRNEQGDVLVKRQVSTEWPSVRVLLEEVREMSVPEGRFVAIPEVCSFNDGPASPSFPFVPFPIFPPTLSVHSHSPFSHLCPDGALLTTDR
jgi:hypothetical protein